MLKLLVRAAVMASLLSEKGILYLNETNVTKHSHGYITNIPNVNVAMITSNHFANSCNILVFRVMFGKVVVAVGGFSCYFPLRTESLDRHC